MEAGTQESAPSVEVNGASLAYREVGEGEPVVLVHGMSSDMRTWEHFLPRIGGEHRAIAYSRRYAWPNAPIPERAKDPMLRHVDDLVAFLEAVRAKPAHLVGHSWGGFVCLLAAIRYPEAVKRLVLMEPAVFTLLVSTPPRPAELLRLLLRRPGAGLAAVRFNSKTAKPAAKAFLRGDDEAGLEIFLRGVIGDRAYERLSPERRAQAWDNVAVDKAQLLGLGFPPLSEQDARGMSAPTLLVTGEESQEIFLQLAKRLAELLPNVRHEVVPRASHIVHEDDPQAVQELVLGFVAGR